MQIVTVPVKKKLLQVYALNEDRFVFKKDISVPEQVVTMVVRVFVRACVNFCIHVCGWVGQCVGTGYTCVFFNLGIACMLCPFHKQLQA